MQSSATFFMLHERLFQNCTNLQHFYSIKLLRPINDYQKQPMEVFCKLSVLQLQEAKIRHVDRKLMFEEHINLWGLFVHLNGFFQNFSCRTDNNFARKQNRPFALDFTCLYFFTKPLTNGRQERLWRLPRKFLFCEYLQKNCLLSFEIYICFRFWVNKNNIWRCNKRMHQNWNELIKLWLGRQKRNVCCLPSPAAIFQRFCKNVIDDWWKSPSPFFMEVTPT